MPIGMIGVKLGMTRVFMKDGASVPVTVVHAPANHIAQVKTRQTDGYFALQLSAGERKPSKLGKPLAKHYAKAGINPGRILREFRIVEEESRPVGAEVNVKLFDVGHKVDVTGISKGKGYAGVVKRHNFRTQDATHGNSLSHRAHGSVGQCQYPGRVFKGKKMAGHLGSDRVTVKNLKVIEVNEEKELLLIQGALPGSPGAYVLVKHKQLVPPTEAPAVSEETDAEAAEVEAKPEVESKPEAEAKPEDKVKAAKGKSESSDSGEGK